MIVIYLFLQFVLFLFDLMERVQIDKVFRLHFGS